MVRINSQKIDITDAYSKGKINEKHFENLKNEISLSYDRVFRKRIDELGNVSSGIVTKDQLNKLKNEMETSYSEQKITETQFTMLNKKFSDLENEDNKPTI